jgi:hypothetical protein
MSEKRWVYEAVLDEYDYWPGNELYDTLAFAKFCVTQDYEESFPDSKDQVTTWEQITKALYHMYLDGDPTGIAIKVRHVNSLDQ